jgi:2,4-dienoyl-CoA reductase-like NADH-dependent reductase (Old Yellow Enzyme family)
MAAAVHEAGGLVALQLVHAGGQTKAEWIGGTTPLGPSATEQPGFGEVAALSTGQIEDIVEAFGRAARRGVEAGFDAVQIHGAHGYLVNQFLSPHTNRREDDYGGSLENRSRFGYEVYDAVRAAVGPDFPVFIKLNSEDCVEGGLTLADALAFGRGLRERGIDAIEVSGGVPAAGRLGPARVLREPSDQGYFFPNAQAFKAVVDCPVIAVGGFRRLTTIRDALESVDAVSMARPFIRQPDLANRFRDGTLDQADCISCGRCMRSTLKHGLTCAVVAGEEG